MYMFIRESLKKEYYTLMIIRNLNISRCSNELGILMNHMYNMRNMDDWTSEEIYTIENENLTNFHNFLFKYRDDINEAYLKMIQNTNDIDNIFIKNINLLNISASISDNYINSIINRATIYKAIYAEIDEMDLKKALTSMTELSKKNEILFKKIKECEENIGKESFDLLSRISYYM